jgi:hypothetical protein
MSLIKIHDGLIVNASEIEHAARNGNYTDVRIRGYGVAEQIWDEHKRLWYAICKAAEKAE